jgi:hypothetical protein
MSFKFLACFAVLFSAIIIWVGHDNAVVRVSDAVSISLLNQSSVSRLYFLLFVVNGFTPFRALAALSNFRTINVVILGSHNQKAPDHDEKNGNTLQHPKSRRLQKIWEGSKGYLIKLRDAGPDRHIELLLAFAIAIFAGRQYSIMKSSSQSSTDQLSKIIVAADRIDDAADSFSGSSAHINVGIENAVNKLNLQAGATKDIAGQALAQTEVLTNGYKLQKALAGATGVRVQTTQALGPSASIRVVRVFVRNYGPVIASNVRVAIKVSINKDVSKQPWPKFAPRDLVLVQPTSSLPSVKSQVADLSDPFRDYDLSRAMHEIHPDNSLIYIQIEIRYDYVGDPAPPVHICEFTSLANAVAPNPANGAQYDFRGPYEPCHINQ